MQVGSTAAIIANRLTSQARGDEGDRRSEIPPGHAASLGVGTIGEEQHTDGARALDHEEKYSADPAANSRGRGSEGDRRDETQGDGDSDDVDSDRVSCWALDASGFSTEAAFVVV